MNMQKTGWVCGFIALAMPLYVVAAGKSHGCAKVRDDTDRLACYDAEFGKPERAATAAALPPPAPAPASAPAAVPAPPAVKAPPVQPEARTERSAASDAPARSMEREAPREQFTAVVAEARASGRGIHTVTLADGQVWRQLEPDSAVEIKAGDSVTIRPAALGSFMLVTKAGVRTRVRLVQ